MAQPYTAIIPGNSTAFAFGNNVLQVNLLMTSKITKWTQGQLIKSHNKETRNAGQGRRLQQARYDTICLIFI